MIRLAAVAGLVLALLAGPGPGGRALAAAAPQFPALTGRVVDDAHVLSPQVQADLTAKLAALEQKTSRQLVVVTLPGLGGYEIEDYGYQLLRHWGIGQKGVNNGVVFIIVPSEHKVRIEVGYGMEGVLTDALSSVILQRAVIPKFKAGDVQGGIVAGADALVEQMGLSPSEAEARLAAAEEAPRHAVRRSPLGGLIPLIIIVVVISSIFRRRNGGGWAWLVPFMFLGGGGRGWGGGRDDWGGGGFSGGGGSGGGGGASGNW